ncbi:MAG: phosphate signaling complex protein PhoU [Pseudomonadota bacterium]
MPIEHSVKSFDTDLDALVNTIVEMGGVAESQVTWALAALTERDLIAGQRAIDSDARLDELEERVDQMAVRLFALRQPMAIDLRLVAMSLKISNDLERVGDYSVNVAKRARRLADAPPAPAIRSLGRLGRLCQDMLSDVIDAYIQRDARKAMAVWHRDTEVDAFYDSVFRELLTYVLEDPRTTSASIDLMFVAKHLERIGDHSTNIAERLHYVIHGDRINRPRSELP